MHFLLFLYHPSQIIQANFSIFLTCEEKNSFFMINACQFVLSLYNIIDSRN